MKIRFIIFFFSAILFYPFISYAQDDFIIQEQDELPRYQLGGFARVNLNFVLTDISNLPGVPNCCLQFNDGSGSGFTLGVIGGYQLAKKVDVFAKIGFNTFGSTLESEDVLPIRSGNGIDSALIRHTINTDVSFISIEPGIDFRFIGGFHAFMGMQFGIVTSTTFDQEERLITSGTFENGKKVRNELSGDINNTTGLLVFIAGGLYYDFPLIRRQELVITPELLFTSGMNSLIEGSNHHYTSIQIGVSIKYSPYLFHLSDPLVP